MYILNLTPFPATIPQLSQGLVTLSPTLSDSFVRPFTFGEPLGTVQVQEMALALSEVVHKIQKDHPNDYPEGEKIRVWVEPPAYMLPELAKSLKMFNITPMVSFPGFGRDPVIINGARFDLSTFTHIKFLEV